MLSLKLLIDADYFFYRASCASEQEHEYSPELTVIVGDFDAAKKIVKQELKKLTTRFDTDDIVLVFTDVKNFRKDIDPNYKGNRVKRKPCGYLKLKKWGMDNYPSVCKPSLEADDVLGILATNGSMSNFIIVSPDKDMQQIPARVYNLKDEFTVTPEEAERKLWEQTLTGDQTDGYSGCPGVGLRRANQILKKVKNGDYWTQVLKAYLDADLTEEDALRNLRLARILQNGDWDSKTQSVILYTPKSNE